MKSEKIVFEFGFIHGVSDVWTRSDFIRERSDDMQ